MFRQFFPGREVIAASITGVFVGLSSMLSYNMTSKIGQLIMGTVMKPRL